MLVISGGVGRSHCEVVEAEVVEEKEAVEASVDAEVEEGGGGGLWERKNIYQDKWTVALQCLDSRVTKQGQTFGERWVFPRDVEEKES